MKKGVNQWCFPGKWDFDKVLEVSSKAQYDGIEINMTEEGLLSLDSTDKEILAIHKRVLDVGLEIPSLSTSLLWNYSLTSNDAKTREQGKHVVKKMIEAASLLEINTILVVPGLVTAEVTYEEAYTLSQEALLELGLYAKENQVTIAIENVWNKFLLSPLEMKRFIQEIGQESIGAYFDVGNILLYGYPEQWLTLLNTYIQKVHVKDFRTSVGNFSGFTSLLQGDVNWKEVMLALANIGYNDYLTVEIPPHRIYPEKSLYDISKSLDFIIQEVHG